MTLKEPRKRALASTIAAHVPLEVLRDVVAEDNIAANFDERVQLTLGQPASKDFQLALFVVECYDVAAAIGLLKRKLCQRMRSNDVFAAAWADVEGSDEDFSNLQAAIAKRARMLRGRELREFLENHEPRICLIAGTAQLPHGDIKFPRGTGFLAGEDLVITARHVLAYHITNGGQRIVPAPGPLYAFFDHLDGDPILDPHDPNIRARRYAFHDDWLKAFSDLVPDDGELAPPYSAARLATFANNLDMVLIRLAEPVGSYPRSSNGGARRGWVALPDPRIPEGLLSEDRIVIPQHPHGKPQQIDFGRYRDTVDTATRILYDTETDPGTSGAPCFNQHFQLVGMHNATFRSRSLNQAIRFDHILRMIQPYMAAVPPPAPVGWWNVADKGATPEVIVGRGKFLRWLADAIKDDVSSLMERVYVAQAKRPYCGKTFTIRILKQALREKSDPVIVMGTRLQSLPRTAVDLLSIVVNALKIPAEELQSMPKRAAINVPTGSPDGDKIPLWSARDLPEWFTDLLSRYRIEQIDERDEAKRSIEHFRCAGLQPNADDERIANLPQPQLSVRQRWERIWIVLDGVVENTLDREARELLAALVGSASDEAALHKELRRIRWLFLGSAPVPGETCVEVLDQMELKPEDLAQCIEAFAMSFNKNPSAELLRSCVGFVEIKGLMPNVTELYADPQYRLRVLQTIIAELNGPFRQLFGVPAP